MRYSRIMASGVAKPMSVELLRGEMPAREMLAREVSAREMPARMTPSAIMSREMVAVWP